MHSFHLPLLLVASVFLAGCVQNVRPISEEDAQYFTPSSVYFATTRNETDKTNLNKRFGKKRAPITYGVNTVSIPANYPKAHSASFIHWNLSLKRNPEKHLAVINTDTLDDDAFFSALKQELMPGSSNTALVFIHGFNTPFERASRISAKMAYDLDLKGPSILFSWPSLERPSAYPADEENLAWSQPAIDSFFVDLFTELPTTQFILLGHSMGNRALTDTLITLLDDNPKFASRITGLVLAAPDIDTSIFERDIAPALVEHALPITLYVSSKDLALYASNRLHGYPRVGYGGDSLSVIQGIDTVDASNAEAELLGHEYFSQGAHTVADIYQWLIEGKSAAKRPNLVGIEHKNGTYWEITP
jgi:esterase/lipase superfamily enzyme